MKLKSMQDLTEKRWKLHRLRIFILTIAMPRIKGIRRFYIQKNAGNGTQGVPVRLPQNGPWPARRALIKGDTLDYLSCGAMELMQKYIFDADPQVLCCLGGHELTKQMETGRPDQLPLEERLAILQKFWRHDIHYAAKLIKNKVLAVAIDNSQSHYLDCQIGRLKKDIETAKEKGYIILLFQHEPISTQNPEDQTCRAIWAQYKTEYNFYDGAIVGGDFANAADRKVYQLITENADVVKGIFCGHLHSVFYNEIQASYTDAQGSHKAVIPQYTLTSNAYEDYAGLLMRIIIQ